MKNLRYMVMVPFLLMVVSIVGGWRCYDRTKAEMVEDLNQTNEVLAYVDADMSDAEAKSIGTKINQIENVYQADFKSRETALKEFVEDHQNDPAFGGLVASDLRHRYVVSLEDNTRMKGKALDDRAGCAMLIEIMRDLHARPCDLPFDVYFAFTTCGASTRSNPLCFVGRRAKRASLSEVLYTTIVAVACSPRPTYEKAWKLESRRKPSPISKGYNSSTLF